MWFLRIPKESIPLKTIAILIAPMSRSKLHDAGELVSRFGANFSLSKPETQKTRSTGF